MIQKDSFLRLAAACEAAAPLVESPLHGRIHWQQVSRIGINIARYHPEVDPWVVLAFGAIHDCRRFDEDADPEHGVRAAQQVTELMKGFDSVLDGLSLEAGMKLYTACSTHTDARRSLDLTIGACYDADRITLPRVGIIPDLRFLSTEASAYIVGNPSPDVFGIIGWDELWEESKQVHDRNKELERGA